MSDAMLSRLYTRPHVDTDLVDLVVVQWGNKSVIVCKLVVECVTSPVPEERKVN
jgi:hypothetical protein